jgi:hypothetical protein
MGREVKRVALDFNWPLNKTWEGFLNPFYKECPSPHCQYGSTVDAAWLGHLVHLILLAGENGSRGRLHPWLQGFPLVPEKNGVVLCPTKRMTELTTGLAGRSPMGRLGHDAIDRWAATAKIIKAAGLPENWGTCPVCNGHAIDPTVYEKYEAWTPTEPPEGPGYQVWETVSEGSPITPVFATPQELARWCVDNQPWNSNSSYETWLRFIGEGWASSFVATPETGFVDGVEAIGKPVKES